MLPVIEARGAARAKRLARIGLPAAVCFVLAANALGAGCSYETVPPSGKPGCKLDSDCSDGLLCNGTETCKAGVCKPGMAVSCGTSDECLELDAGTQCVPKAESIWLVYGSQNASGENELLAVNVKAALGAPPVRLDVGLRPGERVVPGSAAWSPNGRYVAFRTQAMNADAAFVPTGVYLVDMSGAIPGRPMPVVDSGVPFTWAPSSSSLIVTDSVDSLYWLRLGSRGVEAAVRLTQRLRADSSYEWSPMGDRIAFRSDKLYVLSLSATPGIPVDVSPGVTGVTEAGVVPNSFIWSPNGEWIVFYAHYAQEVYLGGPNKTPILVRTTGWPTFAPMAWWSSDSRYVAYSEGENGDELAWLDVTAPTATPDSISTSWTPPCWAPESPMLVFSDYGKRGVEVATSAVLHAASGTVEPLPYYVSRDLTPCWSPKGNYLSLVTWNESAPIHELILLPVKSGGADAGLADAGPDAKAPDSGAKNDASAVDGGGGADAGSFGAPISIDSTRTQAEGEIAYAFAPDESALVHIKGPPDQQALYYDDLSGGSGTFRAELLVDHKKGINPSFSAAGGYLAYTIGQSAWTELYVVDLHGPGSKSPVQLPLAGSGTTGNSLIWQPAR